MITTRKTATRFLTAAILFVSAGSPAFASEDETLSIATIELTGSPAEMEQGFTWLGDGSDTLIGLVNTIDTLAYDDEFSGLFIRLKDATLTTTQVEELGAALSRFREEGKKVHLYAEGYGTADILLGSFVDEVMLQTGGFVSFPGLHMEEMFLADTLSWIGVKAQLVQVGAYKGANEQMTRSSPSPEWDQNISGLLDGMYTNLREIVKDGRNMSNRELDRAMEIAWAADGEHAIQAGLIDSVVDLPDLKKHLADFYDADIRWVKDPYAVHQPEMDFSNPFALFSQMGEKNELHIDHPTIAVLHINGTIVDGDSSSGGMFGGGQSVGSRTIRNAIEDILKEDLIEGVVVRIDSPGGSAIASEVMWQGVERLKAEKPVWVSVGSMAASGGYYVLSAGDKVFVNPSSIVGSIGVVGGKYAMGELYDKAKVHIVERSRGPMGDLFSASKPWDESQLKIIRKQMTETYELFTSRVTAGRDGIDLSKTAEGRLFVGTDAIDLHMADEIGGLDDAINELAVDLDMGDFDVVHYPQPPSFEDFIGNMLGGFLSAPGLSMGTTQIEVTLRTLLGDRRYESVVDTLNGLALLREETVLLISPNTFIFR